MTGPYAAQMIEALAREAGMSADLGRWYSNTFDPLDSQDVSTEHLERFAALVRAAALEEAARLIDQTWQKTPAEYAAAIRAIAATKPESGS
jgi:hypothetical protein